MNREGLRVPHARFGPPTRRLEVPLPEWWQELPEVARIRVERALQRLADRKTNKASMRLQTSTVAVLCAAHPRKLRGIEDWQKHRMRTEHICLVCREDGGTELGDLSLDLPWVGCVAGEVEFSWAGRLLVAGVVLHDVCRRGDVVFG